MVEVKNMETELEALKNEDLSVSEKVEEIVDEIAQTFGENSKSAEAAEQVKNNFDVNWKLMYEQQTKDLNRIIDEWQKQNEVLREKIETMENHTLIGFTKNAFENTKNWFTDVKDSITNWIDNQKELIQSQKTAKEEEKEFIAKQSERLSMAESLSQKKMSLEYAQEREALLMEKYNSLKQQLSKAKEYTQERKTAAEAVKNLFRKKENKVELSEINKDDVKSKKIANLEQAIKNNDKQLLDIKIQQIDIKEEIDNIEYEIEQFDLEHGNIFLSQDLEVSDDLQKMVMEARENSIAEPCKTTEDIDLDFSR